MIKLERALSIDGDLVVKFGDISGLRAYISDKEPTEIRYIYFTNCNDEVVATICIEPDSVQYTAHAEVSFHNNLMESLKSE